MEIDRKISNTTKVVCRCCCKLIFNFNKNFQILYKLVLHPSDVYFFQRLLFASRLTNHTMHVKIEDHDYSRPTQESRS